LARISPFGGFFRLPGLLDVNERQPRCVHRKAVARSVVAGDRRDLECGDLAAPDIDDKAAIVMVETLPVGAGTSDSPGRISADQVQDPA
jgi:hypothetical protein